MSVLLTTLLVMVLAGALTVFAYLDRIYRELGRVTTGRMHAHLYVFEAEIEQRLHMGRRSGGLAFSLLARLWLAAVVVWTARGVIQFVPSMADAAAELITFVALEVLFCMHFIPDLLLSRTSGRWLRPLVPIIVFFTWIVWPLRAGLELAASLARISEDEETAADGGCADSEGIEALVEAAQEEGILEREQVHLIEQVVEFSDKRVLEVMTPRPDIVAIPANATLDQLRRLVVETKFSRIPVYRDSLEDIIGIAYARDLLQIPESEARHRSTQELVRPALFVPETKLGSQLLKELQLKNQQMAIAVDEHGSVAGLVTVEDLVEEIVGEIGEEDRSPMPDVVRQADGSLVMRGSVSLEKVQELFGVEFDASIEGGATTVAGLLNRLAGHVPVPGEGMDYDGLHFEVLEANQRKVLRLRARRHAAAIPAS